MSKNTLTNPKVVSQMLEDEGIRLSHSLGQNFLVNQAIIDKTLKLAEANSSDCILEVGPGIGALTVPLLETGASVVAIEKDSRLKNLLLKNTEFAKNRFTLIEGDALDVFDECCAVKNSFMKAGSFGVASEDMAFDLNNDCPRSFHLTNESKIFECNKLVANLPYNIAATLVLNVFQIMAAINFANHGSHKCEAENVERRLEISEGFFANGLPEAFKGAKRPRSEGNEQKISNGLISPSRETFYASQKMAAINDVGENHVSQIMAAINCGGIESCTIMVQKEVAERMCAKVGSKNYGAYTVKLSLYAEVQDQFFVGRNNFLPAPRVDSAVIRLNRVDRGLSYEVLRNACKAADAAFFNRRKTILNSCKAYFGCDSEKVENWLEACDIDPKIRGEKLEVDDYIRLGESFQSWLP